MPFFSVVTVTPALTLIDFFLERKHFNMWWEIRFGKRRARAWEDIHKNSEEYVDTLYRDSDLLNTIKFLVIFFLLGGHSGVAFTYLAMLIGHVLEPGSFVPRTWGVLITNFICDGVTLAVTFTLIRRAVEGRRLLSLPIRIVKIVAATAILALLSAYVGLRFSLRPLTITETFNVFIGRSRDGSKLDLSPTFWVMHTTFIPTLLYLGVIGLFWLAKLFLTGVGRYVKKEAEMRKPFNLTAKFFGALMALLVLMSAIFAVWQEYLERQEKMPRVTHRQQTFVTCLSEALRRHSDDHT
jgi:hypothetical protein